MPFHGFHRGLRLPRHEDQVRTGKKRLRPSACGHLSRSPTRRRPHPRPDVAGLRCFGPLVDAPAGNWSSRPLPRAGKSLADDARPWTGRPCRFPTMDDQRPPEPDIAGCFLGRATPPCARGHIATVEIRSLLRGRPLGRPECPRVKVWGRVPRRAGLSEGGVGQNGRMRVASGRRVRSLWCWRPARPKQGRLHCASRGAAKRR